MKSINLVNVSVAQVEPAENKEKAILKIAEFAQKAAEKDVQLILFPEAFIGGYPRGSGFGTLIGVRTNQGREAFRCYWEAAIEVPSKECTQIGQIAKRNKLQIVVGVIERDGGTLYCTVIFFSADGELMGKHRKLMPTGSERLVWGFGNGSTMPVFNTPIGKVGAVICWENYMPLMRAAHYAKGIQIYCAPTADGRDTWLPTMRHVAIEGRCFVLTCNQFARKSHYPESYSNDSDQSEIISRGGSCIIDPFGSILVGPNYEGEALLVAEINQDDIPRAKYDFDVTGHYARPDVFSLHVNETNTLPVVFSNT